MASKSDDITSLEARIGHRFANRKIAILALTHMSGARRENYQRLEFLGDRVLGLAVAEMLYESFPASDEGELSRRLADLVRRETCAEVALEWGVDDHVRLGEGERQASAGNKVAILSDV